MSYQEINQFSYRSRLVKLNYTSGRSVVIAIGSEQAATDREAVGAALDLSIHATQQETGGKVKLLNYGEVTTTDVVSDTPSNRMLIGLTTLAYDSDVSRSRYVLNPSNDQWYNGSNFNDKQYYASV